MQPLVIDVHEAARLTSLSPHTIRAYIRQGKLPAVHIGRRVLIEPSALRRFVNSCRPEASDRDPILEERDIGTEQLR
jgi:excisionase family DNA binding protein